MGTLIISFKVYSLIEGFWSLWASDDCGARTVFVAASLWFRTQIRIFFARDTGELLGSLPRQAFEDGFLRCGSNGLG